MKSIIKEESALRDESTSSVRVTFQSLSHYDKEGRARASEHGGLSNVRNPSDGKQHRLAGTHTASHARTNETNTISRLDSPPNLRLIILLLLLLVAATTTTTTTTATATTTTTTNTTTTHIQLTLN